MKLYDLKFFASIFVVILALAAFGAATDWPKYHFDPENTGFSPDFAPQTNNTLWQFSAGNQIKTAPAVVNGIVYFGANDKKVYAVNATTNTTVWTYLTGGNIASSPAVSNGIVYVGSDDSKLYAFATPASLSVTLSAEPGTVEDGDTIYVNLTAVNSGDVTALVVTPNILVNTASGTATASLDTGPTPATASIAGRGGTQVFQYTFIADYGASGGTVTFIGNVTGANANSTNSTSNAVTVTDLTPPTITLTYPLTNIVINHNINLTGTASDANPDSIYTNDTHFTVNSGTYGSWVLANQTVLDEGFYSVLITANDTAGLTAFVIANFTIDKTPPAITLTYPLTNVFVNTMTITGTATDTYPGTVYTNDTHFTVNSGTFGSWSFPNQTVLAEGSYSVLVTAEDEAGNTASVIANFTVDTTPPTITLTYPLTTIVFPYTFTGPINITGTASDANPGTVSTNHAKFTVNSGNYTSWNFTNQANLGGGSYAVQVTASDAAGNTAFVTANFRIQYRPGGGGGGDGGYVYPTPTPTPIATPTPVRTPTPLVSPTVTHTPVPTPVPSPTGPATQTTAQNAIDDAQAAIDQAAAAGKDTGGASDLLRQAQDAFAAGNYDEALRLAQAAQNAANAAPPRPTPTPAWTPARTPVPTATPAPTPTPAPGGADYGWLLWVIGGIILLAIVIGGIILLGGGALLMGKRKKGL